MRGRQRGGRGVGMRRGFRGVCRRSRIGVGVVRC